MLINDIFRHQYFKESRTIIIGVSGGADSLALLLLCHEYLSQQKGPKAKIIAVTIDHKLRAEAQIEAQFVKNICQNYNIEHHIIEWDGSKFATNISALARFNRYKILYECASTYEKPIILVAHNLNDRIETFLMREKRKSNHGLAAMAPISLLFNQIYLYRPLLPISKAELQAYLKTKKQAWIEDPSNKNPKYERASLRLKLGPLSPTMLNFWQKKLETHEKSRQEFSNIIADILKNTDIYFQGEVLHGSAPNHEYSYFAISLLASIMGGASYLPNAKQQQMIKDLNEGRLNICGAIIEKKLNNFIIWREKRNIQALSCPAGAKIIWDNRYYITNKSLEPIEIDIIKTHEVKKYNTSMVARIKGEDRLIFDPNIKLQSLELQNDFIEINKSLSIYSWLVSGFDFPIYNSLKNIFKIL